MIVRQKEMAAKWDDQYIPCIFVILISEEEIH